MKRRAFVSSLPLAAASLHAAAGPSKRERMMQWLAGKMYPSYTPAAFFLHFGDEFKNGTAAARKHLEYFRTTDMDFIKVQFEQTYARQEFLKQPRDWARLKLEREDFYEPLLVTVRELVKAAKRDALILMTLYSPYMCAGQCSSSPVLHRHLEENPDAVKRGLDILTESQLIFVRACIKAGVDGFYMSTQGSEATNLSSPAIFTRYIKPADLVSMKEIQAACPFNILHVCDYNAPYSSYEQVRDYPGHVVNCNPKLTGHEMTAEELSRFFGRPFMGGLDRHGLLATGTPDQLSTEVRRVIKSAPPQFILAADCTVDGKTDWNRLRDVIAIAHRTGR